MHDRLPSPFAGGSGADTLSGALAHLRVRLGNGQPGPF